MVRIRNKRAIIGFRLYSPNRGSLRSVVPPPSDLYKTAPPVSSGRVLSLTGRGTGPCCEPLDVAFCVVCLSKTFFPHFYTILKIVDWDVKYQPNETILLTLADAFLIAHIKNLCHARIQKVLLEGSNSDRVFFFFFFFFFFWGGGGGL